MPLAASPAVSVHREDTASGDAVPGTTSDACQRRSMPRQDPWLRASFPAAGDALLHRGHQPPAGPSRRLARVPGRVLRSSINCTPPHRYARSAAACRFASSADCANCSACGPGSGMSRVGAMMIRNVWRCRRQAKSGPIRASSRHGRYTAMHQCCSLYSDALVATSAPLPRTFLDGRNTQSMRIDLAEHLMQAGETHRLRQMEVEACVAGCTLVRVRTPTAQCHQQNVVK